MPQGLRELIEATWHQQPAMRPSADQVLAILRSEALTKDCLHIAYKQGSPTPFLT